MPEPSTTLPSAILESGGSATLPYTTGDPKVLGWIAEAIQEGDRLLQSDPSYDCIERSMAYVSGDQRKDPLKRPSYLPNVMVNQTAKSAAIHISALTDLRPVYAFRVGNPAFEPHAGLLNQLTLAWWLLRMIDLDLADGIIYALVGGTGDYEVLYDPGLVGGGDIVLRARDPRDTLPIRPTTTRSLQDWEGIILRDAYTPNVLNAQYPILAKMGAFVTSPETLPKTKGRLRTSVSAKLSTPADTLSGLSGAHTQRAGVPTVDVYRVWLKDRSKNLSSEPRPMGRPGTNWSYSVPPGGYLYPRGRLIVSTERAIISDGPSPYWHGLFPIARLKLLALPWQILGIPLFNDLLPLQDAINDTVNDVLMTLKQWTHRGSVYDENAVPRTLMQTFDSRKPNWRVMVNPMAATTGKPFELVGGPDLPIWTLDFLNLMFQKFDERAGSPNLTALMQLQQMPGADTIEAYHKALTPEIKHESRMVEACLRDVAEMVKSNMFQFYSLQKRLALLGDAGMTLADLDLDPGNLIPAMEPGKPGYLPGLDASIDLDRRAQEFLKLFQFYCTPNSILAIESKIEEMKAIQLTRMGYMDFWTMHEKLHTANVGTPPPMPLPPIQPPPPNVVQELQMAATASSALGALGGMAPPPPPVQGYVLDPASGNILQIRAPLTITERLMAQQTMGIGMTVNPAGRKASGQESPSLERKPTADGGERITMSESRK